MDVKQGHQLHENPDINAKVSVFQKPLYGNVGTSYLKDLPRNLMEPRPAKPPVAAETVRLDYFTDLEIHIFQDQIIHAEKIEDGHIHIVVLNKRGDSYLKLNLYLIFVK